MPTSMKERIGEKLKKKRKWEENAGEKRIVRDNFPTGQGGAAYFKGPQTKKTDFSTPDESGGGKNRL